MSHLTQCHTPRARLVSPLLAALLCLSQSAWAQVYVGESASGSVVLSYAPSAETPTLIVSAPPVEVTPVPDVEGQGVRGRSAAPSVPSLPEHYRHVILNVARETKVSAPLIAAVAAAESGFNPRALSPKGAAGLMQLMPDTARRFNVSDRYSVEQSVRGGAAYLRWLSEHFSGDLERVIAAYNAGEMAVERAGGMPNYPETQAYLPRVLGYLQHFKRLFATLPA